MVHPDSQNPGTPTPDSIISVDDHHKIQPHISSPSGSNCVVECPQFPMAMESCTQDRRFPGLPSVPVLKDASLLTKQMTASALGSATATALLNPLFVVKLMLQRNDADKQCFVQGTRVGLMTAVPSSVLYMTLYEQVKIHLRTIISQDWTTVVPGLAGATARFITVTALAPLELIRTVQAGGTNLSATSIMRQVLQREGPAGLYRGLTSTLLRDVPFSAVYWVFFEGLKQVYTTQLNHLRSYYHDPQAGVDRDPKAFIQRSHATQHPTTPSSSLVTFLSGASSAVIATTITHPYDVLKTQQQLGSGGGAEATHPSPIQQRSTSLSGTAFGNGPPAEATSTMRRPQVVPTGLRDIFRELGIRGLYQGLTMRLVTAIPASAIMVTMYEFILKL